MLPFSLFRGRQCGRLFRILGELECILLGAQRIKSVGIGLGLLLWRGQRMMYLDRSVA